MGRYFILNEKGRKYIKKKKKYKVSFPSRLLCLPEREREIRFRILKVFSLFHPLLSSLSRRRQCFGFDSPLPLDLPSSSEVNAEAEVNDDSRTLQKHPSPHGLCFHNRRCGYGREWVYGGSFSRRGFAEPSPSPDE